MAVFAPIPKASAKMAKQGKSGASEQNTDCESQVLQQRSHGVVSFGWGGERPAGEFRDVFAKRATGQVGDGSRRLADAAAFGPQFIKSDAQVGAHGAAKPTRIEAEQDSHQKPHQL
jgi:hypothetical protein